MTFVRLYLPAKECGDECRRNGAQRKDPRMQAAKLPSSQHTPGSFEDAIQVKVNPAENVIDSTRSFLDMLQGRHTMLTMPYLAGLHTLHASTTRARTWLVTGNTPKIGMVNASGLHSTSAQSPAKVTWTTLSCLPLAYERLETTSCTWKCCFRTSRALRASDERVMLN